jgi:hypothetical protein
MCGQRVGEGAAGAGEKWWWEGARGFALCMHSVAGCEYEGGGD